MIFNNDINIIALLQNEYTRKIFLTKFFTINKKATKIVINDKRLNFDCYQLLYQEFSIYIT